MTMLFSSCEERTGYLDEGQQSEVSKLTAKEWLMTYSDHGNGHIYEYDNKTQIYKFELSGKGWIANGTFTDESIRENMSYFQWGFTTENFAVIYMAGYAIEGYWLIEKLTYDELWVQFTTNDPVINPNQNKTFYRFKARK